MHESTELIQQIGVGSDLSWIRVRLDQCKTPLCGLWMPCKWLRRSTAKASWCSTLLSRPAASLAASIRVCLKAPRYVLTARPLAISSASHSQSSAALPSLSVLPPRRRRRGRVIATVYVFVTAVVCAVTTMVTFTVAPCATLTALDADPEATRNHPSHPQREWRWNLRNQRPEGGERLRCSGWNIPWRPDGT